MLNPRLVRILAVAVSCAFAGVVATLFFGTSAKGASRWLIIAGVSVQPSEILKPAFVVVTAQLFALHKTRLTAMRWYAFRSPGHVLCAVGRPARYRPVDADGACLDVHVFSRRRLFAPLSVLGCWVSLRARIFMPLSHMSPAALTASSPRRAGTLIRSTRPWMRSNPAALWVSGRRRSRQINFA